MSPAHKPVLCYVTDRRAFALPPLPSGSLHADAELAPLHESISRAVTAGVDWIQIREKDLDARSLLDLVRFAVAESPASRRPILARILVNDRLDVALAAGATGIHLGEQSLPVGAVTEWRRSMGQRDFLVGASCHSLEAARTAERAGADYIFFGPVFATPSKAHFGPPQGILRLREVCRLVSIPVLAIGGINNENARACLDGGAAGIAAIRLFQDARDSAEIAASIESINR